MLLVVALAFIFCINHCSSETGLTMESFTTSKGDLILDTYFYGEDRLNQFIRVYHPVTSETVPLRQNVYVIIHGGYWESVWNVDNALIDTLAPFLASHGHHAVEIEYRRADEIGGGWPGTNDDIVSALNTIAAHQDKHGYDMNRIVIVGHSAGGQLALWACSEYVAPRLAFRPSLCVGVAPAGNLFDAYRNNTNSVVNYMKCLPPATEEEIATSPYRFASPHLLVPFHVPLLVVTGRRDKHLPPENVDGFFALATEAASSYNNQQTIEVDGEAAATKTSISLPLLIDIPDADHFKVVNASDPAWLQIYNTIEGAL